MDVVNRSLFLNMRTSHVSDYAGLETEKAEKKRPGKRNFTVPEQGPIQAHGTGNDEKRSKEGLIRPVKHKLSGWLRARLRRSDLYLQFPFETVSAKVGTLTYDRVTCLLFSCWFAILFSLLSFPLV